MGLAFGTHEPKCVSSSLTPATKEIISREQAKAATGAHNPILRKRKMIGSIPIPATNNTGYIYENVYSGNLRCYHINRRLDF